MGTNATKTVSTQAQADERDRESGVHRVTAPLEALIERAKADEVQGAPDLSAAQGVVDMLDGVRRTSRLAALALVDARHLARNGTGGSEDVERAFEALSELRDYSKLAKDYAKEARAERRALLARIAELEADIEGRAKVQAEMERYIRWRMPKAGMGAVKVKALAATPARRAKAGAR